MTSIVVKFNKELCQTEDKVTTPYYAAKLQASYLKTLKGTILPDTEDVTLLECYRIIHFLWQDENSNWADINSSDFTWYTIKYNASILHENMKNSEDML